jgi:hypothetical protein
LIVPIVLALFIMLALRLAMEREERSRILGEELALAQQREQVGRDVHDVLGHSLTVITLKTQLARKLVEDDPQRAQAQLDEVLDVSRQALAEVRSAVGGQHVPDLDAQLASSRSALEAAGIAADLPTTASASLPAAGRQLFAWCLREAVTNVIRHADATRCAVAVTRDRLTVADDGVGRTAAVTAGPEDGGPPPPARVAVRRTVPVPSASARTPSRSPAAAASAAAISSGDTAGRSPVMIATRRASPAAASASRPASIAALSPGPRVSPTIAAPLSDSCAATSGSSVTTRTRRTAVTASAAVTASVANDRASRMRCASSTSPRRVFAASRRLTGMRTSHGDSLTA